MNPSNTEQGIRKPECPYCHDLAYTKHDECGCWCHKARAVLTWRLGERRMLRRA